MCVTEIETMKPAPKRQDDKPPAGAKKEKARDSSSDADEHILKGLYFGKVRLHNFVYWYYINNTFT